MVILHPTFSLSLYGPRANGQVPGGDGLLIGRSQAFFLFSFCFLTPALMIGELRKSTNRLAPDNGITYILICSAK